MTINEASMHLKSNLKEMYDARESGNITQLIIEKLSGLNRVNAILQKHKSLSDEQINALNMYVQQLNNHKPVQYVLNEAWFAGMKFFVDEHVLIPRPETEELVNYVLAYVLASAQHTINASKTSPFMILDVGTGSGCIAVALKKKLIDAVVYASDISEHALKTAAINARQNNVEIIFFNADILKDVQPDLPLFNIIVSNPPYITQKESAEMHANVVSYEPHLALFVPDEKPLLFYETIADLALSYLKQNGNLFFEINENYGDDIVTLLQKKGFHPVEIKKDLQGKNRMIKATYNTT